MNPNSEIVPSHIVIDSHIRAFGQDYRFEVAVNPIEQLRNRRCDNTSVGRVPNEARSTNFFCNTLSINNSSSNQLY
ncbi:MAG: hypothetical protein E7356_02785 [Clostridiales bacterium]|nr:hypothetical protein [Clostridiales bacterium]